MALVLKQRKKGHFSLIIHEVTPGLLVFHAQHHETLPGAQSGVSTGQCFCAVRSPIRASPATVPEHNALKDWGVQRRGCGWFPRGPFVGGFQGSAAVGCRCTVFGKICACKQIAIRLPPHAAMQSLTLYPHAISPNYPDAQWNPILKSSSHHRRRRHHLHISMTMRIAQSCFLLFFR